MQNQLWFVFPVARMGWACHDKSVACRQISGKMSYAKWKAVEIDRCLKNGITPTPGPPGGDSVEDFNIPDPSNLPLGQQVSTGWLVSSHVQGSDADAVFFFTCRVIRLNPGMFLTLKFSHGPTHPLPIRLTPPPTHLAPPHIRLTPPLTRLTPPPTHLAPLPIRLGPRLLFPLLLWIPSRSPFRLLAKVVPVLPSQVKLHLPQQNPPRLPRLVREESR